MGICVYSVSRPFLIYNYLGTNGDFRGKSGNQLSAI